MALHHFTFSETHNELNQKTKLQCLYIFHFNILFFFPLIEVTLSCYVCKYPATKCDPDSETVVSGTPDFVTCPPDAVACGVFKKYNGMCIVYMNSFWKIYDSNLKNS